MEKVLQLHLACLQRIGVIIVGPSGSGKSTVWRLLQAALSGLGRPPKLHVLNPKAISRHHLLGECISAILWQIQPNWQIDQQQGHGPLSDSILFSDPTGRDLLLLDRLLVMLLQAMTWQELRSADQLAAT